MTKPGRCLFLYGMDLQIKGASRRSAVSDAPFEVGNRIVSYLLQQQDQLQRVDVLHSESANYEPAAPLLCRWSWEVKERADEEKAAALSQLMQADELFLALVDAEPAADEPASVTEERAALLHLLCLMLQRKRRVKPTAETGMFIHVASGREVPVPPVRMTPKLLAKVAPQIGAI